MNYLSPERKPLNIGIYKDSFDYKRNEINSGSDWAITLRKSC